MASFLIFSIGAPLASGLASLAIKYPVLRHRWGTRLRAVDGEAVGGDGPLCVLSDARNTMCAGERKMDFVVDTGIS